MKGAELYRFDVPGTPVAKGRARSRVIKGKVSGKAIAVHYTPAKTRTFETMVKEIAARERQRCIRLGRTSALPTGPLELVVWFRFEIPTSWPKWKAERAASGQIRHTGKPDCSNLIKSIEDACNGVLWADDGQVVSVRMSKDYTAEEAGTYVVVYESNGVPQACTRAEAGAA